ncbi:hypothetical protein PoB_005710300 [Plakobranchus ocellatus]|uniref:Uncharacterized protein n=1 Tax=Plakobranchus ocellatus TaxID=259542 RepID=A0AAV4CHR4_9GAST|nr:hypothetical protein PoB_005710300 [Plakobranchus ocellatus]
MATELYATIVTAEDHRASHEDLNRGGDCVKRTSVYDAIFPEFFFGNGMKVTIASYTAVFQRYSIVYNEDFYPPPMKSKSKNE